MSGTTRRLHSPAFKARVALAALAGVSSPAQLAEQFGIHRNLVLQWRLRLIRYATEAFDVHRHQRHAPLIPAAPVHRNDHPRDRRTHPSTLTSPSFASPSGTSDNSSTTPP